MLLDGTDVTGRPAERIFRDGLALVPEGKRVFATLSGGFVAVVVGGMGSLPAAALGGLLLGVCTVALQYVLPNNMLVFRDAFLFTGVLLLLVWRPQGLFIRRGSDAVWV